MRPQLEHRRSPGPRHRDGRARAVRGRGDGRRCHGAAPAQASTGIGQDPPASWTELAGFSGAITATAASRVEIQLQPRGRVFSLAVTSDEAPHKDAPPITVGQPSSWSAALDALSAGLTIETNAAGIVFLDPAEAHPQRLFIVAAGNVTTYQDDHLTRKRPRGGRGPRPSLERAPTVGVYTDLVDIGPDELGFDDLDAARTEGRGFRRTAVSTVSFRVNGPTSPMCSSKVGTSLDHRTAPETRLAFLVPATDDEATSPRQPHLHRHPSDQRRHRSSCPTWRRRSHSRLPAICPRPSTP